LTGTPCYYLDSRNCDAALTMLILAPVCGVLIIPVGMAAFRHFAGGLGVTSALPPDSHDMCQFGQLSARVIKWKGQGAATLSTRGAACAVSWRCRSGFIFSCWSAC
jgi:hypothetical protein